jgi:hypothetical protein
MGQTAGFAAGLLFSDSLLAFIRKLLLYLLEFSNKHSSHTVTLDFLDQGRAINI